MGQCVVTITSVKGPTSATAVVPAGTRLYSETQQVHGTLDGSPTELDWGDWAARQAQRKPEQKATKQE